MSRTRWIAVTVAALGMGLFVWRSAVQLHATPQGTGVSPAAVKANSAAPATTAIAPGVAGKPPMAALPRDYEAAYRDADDLLAYLKSLAPAADAGDAGAMYWMFRASRRCVRDYTIYFGRGEHEVTLERALARNYPTLDERSTRELYAKCANFKAAGNNPYRDWRAMLKRASDAGNPVAEATQAGTIFSNLNSAPDAASQQRMNNDMVALARDALQSKDPAVLMEISKLSVAHVIAGDERNSREVSDTATVWILAACQRGYDCSVDNEEFRAVCVMDKACQPSDTLVDFFRRYNPEGFDALELRATELNAKLDANRFDDIDL